MRLREYFYMNRLGAYVVTELVFFLATLCHAQGPLDVSACDLVKEPQRYTKQLVRVRGQVSLAFEDFMLNTGACEDKHPGIWLAYGGDEPTPTMSTVNDQLRKPGMIPKIDGIPMPLQHDAALELFKKRLAARRISGLDQSIGCYDRECYFYDVTATLTGFFLAAPNKPLGGYGHLGCCHLLVIQRVSAVDARRTMVPAGGQFACLTDQWNIPALDIEKSTKRRVCTGLRDCEKATAEQLRLIAKHWDDDFDPNQGHAAFLTGVPIWRSADLMTTYSLQFQYETDKHKKEVIKSVVASRTRCNAVVAPYPMETPIGCRNLWSEFSASETDVKNIERETAAGRETWRLGNEQEASFHALQEAARQWNIELAPNLTPHGCSNPLAARDNRFSQCTWTDPGSMQVFSIQITRVRSHSHKGSNSPWRLAWGSGIACASEPPALKSDGQMSDR